MASSTHEQDLPPSLTSSAVLDSEASVRVAPLCSLQSSSDQHPSGEPCPGNVEGSPPHVPSGCSTRDCIFKPVRGHNGPVTTPARTARDRSSTILTSGPMRPKSRPRGYLPVAAGVLGPWTAVGDAAALSGRALHPILACMTCFLMKFFSYFFLGL